MEALTGKPVRTHATISRGWAEIEPNPEQRSADEAAETFKHLLDSIIKYKRLIVRMIVAGGLLAGIAMLLMSPTYTATAYLAVQTRHSGATDVPGSAAFAAATEEAAIDTHITVLSSDAFLLRVLQTLRALDAADDETAAPTWGERASTFLRNAWSTTKRLLLMSRQQSSDGEALVAMKKRLRVGQERKSRIVSVTISDTNPQRAALVANLIAQSYVDELAQQRQSSETHALNAIDAQSSAIQRELVAIKAELDAKRPGQGSAAPSADQEWQLTTLAQQYEMLLRRRQELATRALVTEPEVALTQSASQPELPSSLNPILLIPPVTIFLGLLACLLAVILNRFDRTLHTEAEATEALRIPCAGLIPLTQLEQGRLRQRTTDQPAIACTKAVRSAFVSLLASDPIATPSSRVVLVTSGTDREGKTAVSRHFSLYAAQFGKRVLLLDFGHSSRHARSDTGDLTRVLMHGDALNDAIRHVQQLGVDYLPAGFPDRDRPWLLASPKMPVLFERLRDSYDLVVIDAPSLGDAPEVRLLARLADHVVLAVRAGSTNRDVAQRALRQLARTEGLNTSIQFWTILTSGAPSAHQPLEREPPAKSPFMTPYLKLKAALTSWARIGSAIPISRRSRST